MALDEDLIMSLRRIAECHQSHIASSMSRTIGPHESDAQSYAPSMMHTPAGGIDEEIDVDSLVRRFTRSLRPLRSTVTPISVLPPELLLRIFHFHALEVPPWSDGPQKLGWIEVTHVCQRWRQVALGDSSLWARIPGLSPDARWIAEMLVRSRNVPLAISIAVTPGPEILSMFPPHTFRIRELRLCGLSLPVSACLWEICALEAPALEHFEIGVMAPYPVTFRPLGCTTLFRGAPKLRTFSISKISIPWTLIPRGQLTQLKITPFRGVSMPRTLVPSPSIGLLDLLINNPDLEVLVLAFCLPTMVFQPPDGQVIHLPRLSRLCLGGSPPCVAKFMKMLQLPSSTTLHLQCSYDGFPPHDANMIFPLVSAHFHNPAPVEFRSLRITIDMSEVFIDAFTFTAHPTKLTTPGPHAFEDDTDSDAELTMSFGRVPSCYSSTPEEILEAVFKTLPILNLEFLSISVDGFCPSLNWYELSQRCAKITTIRACGRGTIGLLRSLAPIKPTKTRSGSKGTKGICVNRATRAQGAITSTTGAHARIIPFPKLTSLLLENLNFRFFLARYGDLYDVLAYVLRQRVANNTPLNMLGVDRCFITSDRVKGLKRYVQELRWDGGEGPSLDERDCDSNFDEYLVDSPPGSAVWG